MFLEKGSLLLERFSRQDLGWIRPQTMGKPVEESEEIAIARMVVDTGVSKKADPIAIEHATYERVRFPKHPSVRIEIPPDEL
jgi:hypothetical protein